MLLLLKALVAGIFNAHARRCKSKRDKESATFILMHLDNEDLKDELSQPQFLQNGPEIFDHIRGGGGGGGGSGSSDDDDADLDALLNS